jgi:hypothetical protein
MTRAPRDSKPAGLVHAQPRQGRRSGSRAAPAGAEGRHSGSPGRGGGTAQRQPRQGREERQQGSPGRGGRSGSRAAPAGAGGAAAGQPRQGRRDGSRAAPAGAEERQAIMAGAHWTTPERGNQRTPERGNRRPRSVETSAPPGAWKPAAAWASRGGRRPRPCEPAAAWAARRGRRPAPPTGRTSGSLGGSAWPAPPTGRTSGSLGGSAWPAPPTGRTSGSLGGSAWPAPRSVETSGGSAWPATPTGRTSGGLPAPAGRLRGGGLDFAEPLRPVLVENPPPIVAGPQTLAVGVAPDHARGGLDGIGANPGRGNPIAQFREVFDDHARIIPGRGNRRNPRPWKPDPRLPKRDNTNCPPQDIVSQTRQPTKCAIT